MDFNDTVNKDGLIQNCEINLFGDSPFGTISSNADRLQIFTNFLNEGYSRYGMIALQSDNSWQFDDRNNTDLPIATTNMSANTPDYSLATEHVIIDQVEMLDNTGTVWLPVPEMDERLFAEFKQSLSQYNNNIAGIPQFHAKVGNSLYLYPTPNYSMTNGIKVRFKRAPNLFTTASTTTQPSMPMFHTTYLTDYASAKYAQARLSTEIYNKYQSNVLKWEQVDIPAFYADRSLEKPGKLSAIIRNTR